MPPDDTEVLGRVFGTLDPGAGPWSILRRNGHILLGLPRSSEAAGRALRLYQPQRKAARLVAGGLNILIDSGMHGPLLPKFRGNSEKIPTVPLLTGIETGSCGVMLGSPEHRVRRAIASYRTDNGWEVAKIAFGQDGIRGIEREAEVLAGLQNKTGSAPRLIGVHHGEDFALLRMPYLTGIPIPMGETREALALLNEWKSDLTNIPAADFSEWSSIDSAISSCEQNPALRRRLAGISLKPVICHGDFARWNLLRRNDGSLIVLDWEWGRENGMPGIDLAHYFAQDARLVRKLSPTDAVRATVAALETPPCRQYLADTGWTGSELEPVIASLAFKQGARQQDNLEILKAALDLASSNG